MEIPIEHILILLLIIHFMINMCFTAIIIDQDAKSHYKNTTWYEGLITYLIMFLFGWCIIIALKYFDPYD